MVSVSLVPRLDPSGVPYLKSWRVKLILLDDLVSLRLNSWVYEQVKPWISLFLIHKRICLGDLRSSLRILVRPWVKVLPSWRWNWFDCLDGLLLWQNGRLPTSCCLKFSLNLNFGFLEACDRRSHMRIDRNFILNEILLLFLKNSRWPLLSNRSTLQLPAFLE